MPRDEDLVRKAYELCEKQLEVINKDRERFGEFYSKPHSSGKEMQAPQTTRALINSCEADHVLAIMASLAMDKPVPASVWDRLRKELDDD